MGVHANTKDSIINRSGGVPSAQIDFDTTAPANDELTKEIRVLLEAMNYKQSYLKTSETMFQEIAKQLPSDYGSAFLKNLMKEMQQPEILRWVESGTIKAYRNVFTIKEVKQLTEFYQSEIGKKFIELSPALTKQILANTMPITNYVNTKSSMSFLKDIQNQ